VDFKGFSPWRDLRQSIRKITNLALYILYVGVERFFAANHSKPLFFAQNIESCRSVWNAEPHGSLK
jgi:hypothetical protein